MKKSLLLILLLPLFVTASDVDELASLMQQLTIDKKKLHLVGQVPPLTCVPRIQLTAALTVINLWCNEIKRIENSTFGVCPGLTHLNLSYNELAHLAPFAFSGTQLETLDLSNNRFTETPHFSPTILKTLTTLLLSKNKILTFHGAPFDAVTTLDLSNNKLTKYPSSLPLSLVVLNLAYNTIKTLPVGNQTETLIEKLNLSNNAIGTIPTTSLKHHKHLKVLKLNDNKIRFIASDALPKHGLDQVDFCNNALQEIPTYFFGPKKATVIKTLAALKKAGIPTNESTKEERRKEQKKIADTLTVPAKYDLSRNEFGQEAKEIVRFVLGGHLKKY